MLLDKLWVRIRGSLLSLKDDFSLGEDMRRKAEELLAKLDLGAETEPSASRNEDALKSRQLSQPQKDRTASLEEIRQEWEDLLRQQQEGKGGSSDAPQRPNPRKLG